MKSESFQLEVECYAGYRADQRPLRFRLTASRSAAREVVRVLDQWYGPEDRFFKVLAGDGHSYILRHNEVKDLWTLEAFGKRTQR